MTPEQARTLLPIMQAYAEGKVVQYRHGECPWDVYQSSHPVDFIDLGYEWRVKPAPREWWLCPTHQTIIEVGWEAHSKCFCAERVHVREVIP